MKNNTLNGCIINPDGTIEYFKDGKRHRIDGPAIEKADGSKEWWVHDRRHIVDE